MAEDALANIVEWVDAAVRMNPEAAPRPFLAYNDNILAFLKDALGTGEGADGRRD